MAEQESQRPVDAFLIDKNTVPPSDLKRLVAEHTEGWPTEYCVRSQEVEGRLWIYVTPSPECTLLHVKTDERRGKPRYEWEEVAPGVRLGRLIDEDQRELTRQRIAAWIALGH